MAPATSICGLSGCGKSGSLKCSACAVACYCSAECQRKDWKEHKKTCVKKGGTSPTRGEGGSSGSSSSGSRSINTPVGLTGGAMMGGMDPRGAFMKLKEMQKLADDAGKTQDFKRVVALGEESLKIAPFLPEPGCSFEMIRINMNLAQMYQNLGQWNSANDASKKAIERARGAYNMPGDAQLKQQASEMYMSSCLCRAHHLLDSGVKDAVTANALPAVVSKGKLTEAKEAAEKACSICDEVFGPKSKNPTRFKPLRVMGLIKDRLGDSRGAEKDIHEAYQTVVQAFMAFIDSPQAKATSRQEDAFKNRCMLLGEQQMLIDELIGICMRRQHVAEAEKAETYAATDFKVISEERKIPKDHLVYADALTRLAQLRLSVPNKKHLADEDMTQAVKIREGHFGSKPDKQKLVLADSYVMLAKCRESRGMINTDTESLLKQASRIYAACRDDIVRGTLASPFQFHKTIDTDLARIAMMIQANSKNEASGGGTGGIGAKQQATSTGSGSDKGKQQQATSTSATKTKQRSTGEKFSFEAGDGQGRMRAAASLYEDERYSDAVIVLGEALDIFTKQHGPDHAFTANAQNNLVLATNQELNCLWREVIEEMNE